MAKYMTFDPVSGIINGDLGTPDENFVKDGIVKDPGGQFFKEREALVRAGALTEMIKWDGVKVFQDTDPRTHYTVTIETVLAGPDEEKIILSDGKSEATLVFNMVDEQGDSIVFTGKKLITFFNNGAALLDFTNGVATHTFTTNASGLYFLTGTNTQLFRNPISLTAVE